MMKGAKSKARVKGCRLIDKTEKTFIRAQTQKERWDPRNIRVDSRNIFKTYLCLNTLLTHAVSPLSPLAFTEGAVGKQALASRTFMFNHDDFLY
jgi:hypothetical protein